MAITARLRIATAYTVLIPGGAMSRRFFRAVVRAGLFSVLGGGAVWTVWAQATIAPTNDAPNPHQTIEGWAKMPAGRTWGSTSAVDIDKDGVSIWVGERCGMLPDGTAANSCWNASTQTMSPLDTVLKFDASGKLV